MTSVRVSVVIVNYNGERHLPDCLAALNALDWPADDLEIILVDNASSDASLALARQLRPDLKVLAQTRNTGFAPACNIGARAATGDYLAFLNNDLRVEANWLRAMTAPFADAPADLACVASVIRSWDGRLVDFVGGALNAYGRAFQVDQGLPYDPARYAAPREVLFACGGAMLVRRDIYQQTGGFDDDFGAYFEDVDFGWRLWLHGYRVVLAPAAQAYHRLHGTGRRLDTQRRFAISELNALRMVVKNVSDERLYPLLTTALLLGAKRAELHGRLRPEDYVFPGPLDQPSPEADEVSRLALAYVMAQSRLADELPDWLAKRARVQAGRRRSDAELFARFPLAPANPIFPWRRHAIDQEQALQAVNVSPAPRAAQPPHLLIVSHETLGPKMAGPGVRALELARVLAAHARVTLAAPGRPAADAPGVTVLGYQTEADLEPAFAAADAVLAIGQLVSRWPRLRQLDRPLIVDWYDPFEIEKLAQAEAVPADYWRQVDRESHLDLALQARAGDFFICASDRQRDYWLGVLLASGRARLEDYAHDPTLRTLIDVVPFGLPAAPPRRTGPALKGVVPGIGPEDKVLYWGGGLWQWFDPLLLVEALAELAQQRPEVKVFFAAGRHFDTGTVAEMPIYRQVVERARALGLFETHLFFGDWVPYARRGDFLLEADLGVSVHRAGLESRFAFRTRFLDYLWAGLPMVVSAGDPLAELVDQHGLGRVVPPGDQAALTAALAETLAQPDLRERLAPRFAAVAAQFQWERVAAPLVRFLQAPRFAPDARRVLADLDLAARVKTLEAELHAVRGTRVMRAVAWVERLRRGR